MDTPNNNPTAFPDETLDLKRYFFLFLGKWYFIAIAVFVGLFVAYLVNRYSEQVYSVRATLLVGNVTAPMKQGVQTLLREMNMSPDRKMIENEIGILKSYSIAREAIAELPDFKITYVSVGRRGIAESKMYTRSPFRVELDTARLNLPGYPVYITILNQDEYLLNIGDESNEKVQKFGEMYSDSRFSFIVNLVNNEQFETNKFQGKYYFVINNEHGLAISYMRRVAISLNSEDGSLLSLSSQGFVSQQEADYLNKLMEIYIRNDLNGKMQTSINTIKFVDEQLGNIADSLRKAELNILNFRKGKGIINLSVEGKTLFDQLTTLHNEKNMLTFQVEYFKYFESYLNQKKDLKGLVAPATVGIDDAIINTIVSQINQLSLERDKLLFSIDSSNIQITKVNQNIGSLMALLYEKLEGMRQINKLKINEIDKKILEQEEKLSLLPGTEREWVNIERKYSIQEKFYTYLMEKRIEAGIAKASNTADSKVIDYARPEMASVVKPNRKTNYSMGLIIGLLIPLGLIFLFDQLNNSIKDPSEIGRKTSAPLIGTIGNNPYETFLPVMDKPKSSFTESFRALRTNIDMLLGGVDKKVILVSSTISGEGKSFVASNLAVSLAMLGKKTALLGLDLRKPKVHNLFSIDNSKGISTYLVGRDNIESITAATKNDNLFILPAGPIPPNPAEMLASEKLVELITQLKKEYEYIVIDSPPVAVVTDAILINKHCDATVFVIRHRYTSRNVLTLIDELARNKSVKNMALLLNDFKKPKGYGYSYGYGYGYAYSYGYGYSYSDTKKKSGYYTDDLPPLSWKERFKNWL